jgi:hypothetical protein
MLGAFVLAPSWNAAVRAIPNTIAEMIKSDMSAQRVVAVGRWIGPCSGAAACMIARYTGGQKKGKM